MNRDCACHGQGKDKKGGRASTCLPEQRQSKGSLRLRCATRLRNIHLDPLYTELTPQRCLSKVIPVLARGSSELARLHSHDGEAEREKRVKVRRGASTFGICVGHIMCAALPEAPAADAAHGRGLKAIQDLVAPDSDQCLETGISSPLSSQGYLLR